MIRRYLRIGCRWERGMRWFIAMVCQKVTTIKGVTNFIAQASTSLLPKLLLEIACSSLRASELQR